MFQDLVDKYDTELSIKDALLNSYQEEFPKLIKEKEEQIQELERQKK
jgi:hypothetical protein